MNVSGESHSKKMTFVIVYRTYEPISQYDLLISYLFSHGVFGIKLVEHYFVLSRIYVDTYVWISYQLDLLRI